MESFREHTKKVLAAMAEKNAEMKEILAYRNPVYESYNVNT